MAQQGILLSVAFAFIHGAVRYGWSGIAAFIAICLVVSKILESVKRDLLTAI